MVNIKGFTQCHLGDTADLASVIIPLSSSASLSLPIFSIPMVSAKVTFPVSIIQSHLLLRQPPTPAGFRAEVMLPSVKQRVLTVKDITAILTGKIKFWIITRCVHTASINRLPLVTTLIRAIRMMATLDLRSLAVKLFATYFTSHTRSIA